MWLIVVVIFTVNDEPSIFMFEDIFDQAVCKQVGRDIERAVQDDKFVTHVFTRCYNTLGGFNE